MWVKGRWKWYHSNSWARFLFALHSNYGPRGICVNHPSWTSANSTSTDTIRASSNSYLSRFEVNYFGRIVHLYHLHLRVAFCGGMRGDPAIIARRSSPVQTFIPKPLDILQELSRKWRHRFLTSAWHHGVFNSSPVDRAVPNTWVAQACSSSKKLELYFWASCSIVKK